MFTIEVKVNSDVIISITGWNRGYVRNNVKPDTCRYGYSYAKENELHKNEVRHRRSDGMDKLIILILKDVEKQRKKLAQKEAVNRGILQAQSGTFAEDPRTRKQYAWLDEVKD